jgi:superfamily I DNA/RNA helicase
VTDSENSTTRSDANCSAEVSNKVAAAAAAWQLVGIDDLEPAAWCALRGHGCGAMTAGPGAGKTEFLAQRAAYLLQTGLCPPPRRILAISFKRDAAANLGRRVRTRLPEHSGRFISMTFDAFTKSLVDRFRSTLPPKWALHGTYNLAFPTSTEQRDFINNLSETANPGIQEKLFALPRDKFLSEVVGIYDLPPSPPAAVTSATDFAALAWWKLRYLRVGTQNVDFVMLNRLAELLVRTTPHIQRALRLTYPFVFVDEFQDTTYAQYSFLRSVFGNGTTVTVVGDRKQRIMGWAGALGDAFADFVADFTARPYALTWNFRSSEPLVKLQHEIATRLDPAVTVAVSKAATDITDEPARIWSFTTEDREAQVIADWIAADAATSGRTPSAYALVARQKVAGFEERLRTALGSHGIRVRNDDALVGRIRLQDLLKDDISRLLVGILRLAAAKGGQPAVWLDVCAMMMRIRGANAADELVSRAVTDDLAAFIRHLRGWLIDTPLSVDTAAEAVGQVVDFVDFDHVQRELATHQRVEDVQVTIDAFKDRMNTVVAMTTSWWDAFEEYESANAVPLLTVHRSKGLEYHTVFFLGLDGDQWWAHAKDTLESTSTFFVGLSRAAQRTIFTSCGQRGNRAKIADLYAILAQAGVEEQHWG